MHHNFPRSLAVVLILISIATVSLFFTNSEKVFAQKPTLDIATVTSTPSGPIITVKMDANQPQINVRSGPGIFYDKVGVLLMGQKAPAVGRSQGGDWILIQYPGIPGGAAWVFSPLVDITPGSLPIVEPPPTPTPLMTMTIDPTLAAEFVVTPVVTRLPTFTAPPPLAIPTFQDQSGQGVVGRSIPMGFVIIGLASFGIILGLFAFTQGR